MTRIDNLASTNRLATNQQYLLPGRGHEPVQILTGEGVNDEVTTTADGQSVDFVGGMLDTLRVNSPYDYVMIYDPVKCQVRFLDEIAQKNGSISKRMRTAVLTAGLELKDPSGETDLIAQLLREKVLSQFESSTDRVLLDMVEELIKDGNKVLLVIDDAGRFIYSDQNASQMEMLPAGNRANNSSLIDNLAKTLKQYPQSKIILIDRQNRLACLKGHNLEIHHVGTPDRAELQPLIREKIISDKWKLGVELARGITLNKVRGVLERCNGDEAELLAELKKFKVAEVVRLSGGTLKCNMDECTREMLSMNEEEANFWDELAINLKDGRRNELLDQGILLIGPPGTGKSVRARYLASNMGVPYLELDDISSKGLKGMKEDRVRQAFEATISIKPCILFVDEIDKYLPRTEGLRNGVIADDDDAQVAAYIQRMMGSKEMEGVVIVGAGNNPDQMNEALLRSGRFGQCVAVLSPKTIEEKVSVFRAVLKQFAQTRHLLIPDQLLRKLLSHANLQDANGSDYGKLIRSAARKQPRQEVNCFWAILCQELNTFKFRTNFKIAEMEATAREMHTAFELKESNTPESLAPIDTTGLPGLAISADIQQGIADKNNKRKSEERQEEVRLKQLAEAEESKAKLATEQEEARVKQPEETEKGKMELAEEQEKVRLKLLEKERTKTTPVPPAMVGSPTPVTAQDSVPVTQVVPDKSEKSSETRELSPERASELLAILKKRLEAIDKPYRSLDSVEWAFLQKALEAYPEKLWALNEMERTGGEPDLVGTGGENNAYVFMDCSAESPTGRRNCVYNSKLEKQLNEKGLSERPNGNAVDMAKKMGIYLLTQSHYKFLQTCGEFDKGSISFLHTPVDRIQKGKILVACNDNVGELINPNHFAGNLAFRGSLWVPTTPNERGLSPDKAAMLMTILENRFWAKHDYYKRAEKITWEYLQQSLKANPKKLWSLWQMERTGGWPDVVGFDEVTGEYIFMDCSAESPLCRRNCVYSKEDEEYLRKIGQTSEGDGMAVLMGFAGFAALSKAGEGEWDCNAISMAALMGVDILDEKQYLELQTKGKFDKKSSNWLKSLPYKTKNRIALWANHACVESNTGGYINSDQRGFRASLRVKGITPQNTK